MDRAHLKFALRRPRTCMRHKPRLENCLFLDLNKTNGPVHPHAFHDHDGSKASAVGFRKGETKETSHESSESFDTYGESIKQRQCHSVYSKDLNQLGRNGHTDKVRCKPDTPNQTQKNERVSSSRSLDADTDEVALRDNGTGSRVHHSARHVWKKYDMEHFSKAKLEPERHAASRSKPVSKSVENKATNKVGKRNPTFNVDCATYHLNKAPQSLLKTEKKKGFHEIAGLSCPEMRRRRGYADVQETADYEDDHLGGQSSPDSDQNMRGNYSLGTPKTPQANGTEGLQVATLRKSSRVPKKRMFDDNEEEPMRKQRKWRQVECAGGHDLNAEHNDTTDLAGDENKCFVKEYHKEDEVLVPNMVEKKELPLTARQRALRLSKEGGEPQNGNNVDFPDGLQPVILRKQKESLNEAEQAIKKEEAARRRKQQMERNAKEIQASAIQKILGQESSRKKREEKLQKQREEIEQEKQAASMAPAVNSIRWVMGPSGNSVSFSQDVELPKIFSGPCSYPREREKCAGPSCNNVYKYRDAKTRLPLCSLQCYRAVQDLPRAVC